MDKAKEVASPIQPWGRLGLVPAEGKRAQCSFILSTSRCWLGR